MQRFKSRISKLENRHCKQSTSRVLCYNPADCADGPTSPDLPVCRLGPWGQSENPACGPLCAFSGRFMLVPDHGTDAEWMAAVIKQQRKLMASAADVKLCA